jgi:hypothetical protein
MFASSKMIGQGNPGITVHPDTPERREATLKERGLNCANPQIRANPRREIHASSVRSALDQWAKRQAAHGPAAMPKLSPGFPLLQDDRAAVFARRAIR